MEDDADDSEPSPRWWLDRGDPERAARLLEAGDFVRTSPLEHEELCRELDLRGLVCVFDQGGTWVWTARQAAELALEEAGTVTAPVSLTGELAGARRGARRGSSSGAGVPDRSRSRR